MYLRDHTDGVVILVRVRPCASRNALSTGTGDRIVVKLTAPPVEGRANKDLLKFLGKKLGVPSSSLTIISGYQSRDKAVLVRGMDSAAVRERVEA